MNFIVLFFECNFPTRERCCVVNIIHNSIKAGLLASGYCKPTDGNLKNTAR